MSEPFGVEFWTKERQMRKLKHELSETSWSEWWVEAIDMEDDGCCYSALFTGPEAEERAKEYAEWKNGEGAGGDRGSDSEVAGVPGGVELPGVDEEA